MKPTLRLRLTLIYGGIVAAAGSALLALAYVLVARGLGQQVLPDRLVLPRAFQSPLVIELDPAQREALQAGLRDEALDTLLQQGLVALVAVTALGVLLAYLVAGRVLQPLQQITATARRLSVESLDQRIALQGPQDELKELADTFDAMLARLDAAFDAQRRFVANASHELRTPLSVMRTEVDVALADPAADVADLRRMGSVVREATERADRLVDALLLLAASDALSPERLPSPQPVDLAAVAATALSVLRREIEQHGLRADRVGGPAPVTGDLPLLDRLAGNLVENAVRHNLDGGWLVVRTGTAGGWSRLQVAASGPLVGDTEAEELFAPFRRGGRPRTGSRGAGLGLSVVRSVAQAHGGTASARPVEGGGLEVTVDMPAAGEHVRSGSE